MNNISLTVNLDDRKFTEFIRFINTSNIKVIPNNKKDYYTKIINNIIKNEIPMYEKLIAELHDYINENNLKNILENKDHKLVLLNKILTADKISNDDKINWIVKYNDLLE
jgi:predicted RNA-binding protein